jgi:hypothetical protein
MAAGRLRHRRARYVTACAGLAVLAVAGTLLALPSGHAGSALGPGSGLVRLSAAPLGVNTAPWDSIYSASAPGSLQDIQPLLTAAGIRQLHYGGSYADYYDWQTNTNIQNCLPDDATASFTSSCASTDSLDFSQFSQQARAIGAQSFVTINYGSGTPAEAAAWVTQATRTPGEAVALWEVGNESYGCWEVDNELAGPPAYYRGYRPRSGVNSVATEPNCPQVTQGSAVGTQTLATSYAVNARRFLQAMTAANPAAKIGVPWAFGDPALGGAIPDGSEWNNTVLGADGKYVSFVDVHYYPFYFSGGTGGAHPADQQVLQALQDIPSLYGSIRAELETYDPRASVVVGETSVSSGETTTVCTPVGALFAAGDVLSWLAAGAESVDWWDLNNYGNTGSQCIRPDYGLVTSSARPVAETPYYGYQLASVLAQPDALLGTLATSDPSDVLAFQAVLPDGQHAMAFININTSSTRTVRFRPSVPLAGVLRMWVYSAGEQNSTDSNIVASSASAHSVASGITVPAESMTVLETQ